MPPRKRARTALVRPATIVGTLAGSCQRGVADGPAAEARFNSPCGVAIDADGNAIVADHHCIRKIAPDGTVSTLAGQGGNGGYADGPAADARFNSPYGVAIGADGNVIVAGNHCIRKITTCGLGRGTSVPRWFVGPTSIASDWLRMLGDSEFADTTFEVEGTRITAHRAILVIRSEYFRGMLTSGCRETQPGAVIQIGECTPAAFRKLLTFLYCDGASPRVEAEIRLTTRPRACATRPYIHDLCATPTLAALDVDDEVVIDVMRKAREYDLTRAYHMCLRHCVRAVCSSNAIAWLLRADEYQLDELRDEMLKYVKRHFRAIREEAHETLAALRANPDLMLEVMDGLHVI